MMFWVVDRVAITDTFAQGTVFDLHLFLHDISDLRDEFGWGRRE